MTKAIYGSFTMILVNAQVNRQLTARNLLTKNQRFLD